MIEKIIKNSKTHLWYKNILIRTHNPGSNFVRYGQPLKTSILSESKGKCNRET